MAIVSESAGLQQTETTSTFLRQLAILLMQLIQDGKKKGYQDEHLKGAKAIIKHIKHGGKTAYQMVDVADAALFEKILKKQKVPYVQIAEADGKAVFITRDCDNKALEEAWDILKGELQVGYKEQTPHEFINHNAEQNICQSTGYSEVEIEIFRREAAKMGFNYAIVANEKTKGQHDILYSKRDKAAVEKAIKSMYYNISGADGEKYRKAMEESISVKNDILFQSKQNCSNTLYIVNANNPMQFISISDGKMIEHNLTTEEKKDRDGKMRIVVKDHARKTFPFGNRELTQAMRSYGKCSIVPKEHMSFIKGFDDAGNVIVSRPTDLYNATVVIRKGMQDKTYAAYESNMDRSNLISAGKLRTLSNIDPEKLLEITKELSKAGIAYTAVNDSVAYKDKDSKLVKEVLDRTLYKEMKFRDKFESMCFYEGRGPEGLDLNNLKEAVYITSTKDPSYVLYLDEKGCTVYKDGGIVTTLDAKYDNFDANMASLIMSMNDIAVLTEPEMYGDPEDKVDIIEKRSAVKENDASVQYGKSYSERKEQFLNTKYESLSPEDKEIVKRHTSHEVRVTYVDRTFMDKIIDRDFGTKMKEQNIETTKTTKTIHESPDQKGKTDRKELRWLVLEYK